MLEKVNLPGSGALTLDIHNKETRILIGLVNFITFVCDLEYEVRIFFIFVFVQTRISMLCDVWPHVYFKF